MDIHSLTEHHTEYNVCSHVLSCWYVSIVQSRRERDEDMAESVQVVDGVDLGSIALPQPYAACASFTMLTRMYPSERRSSSVFL